MSAPAHTPSSAVPHVALEARILAVGDRVLPYLGPGLALVLGAVALGRRSLDVGEAAAVAAAQGSFSDVVERALSDDPARAGYLALLQPVVAWNDAEHWVRLPSVLAAVVAAIAVYRLGRRLAGRHAGAAASIILATSLGVVLLSRAVGPLALALATMLVSSALFARAVERGNPVWWAVYAVSAALLPLTHPIAAAALGAQVLALVAARREVNLRLAVPAVAVATVECAFFLAAAAIDRADAADGAGSLELGDVGAGIGRAVGWSPVVAALAVWGPSCCSGARSTARASGSRCSSRGSRSCRSWPCCSRGSVFPSTRGAPSRSPREAPAWRREWASSRSGTAPCGS